MQNIADECCVKEKEIEKEREREGEKKERRTLSVIILSRTELIHLCSISLSQKIAHAAHELVCKKRKRKIRLGLTHVSHYRTCTLLFLNLT